ncbi:unnamed protein product, partial [Vitis vinifera]|uniref:COBRA-like protein n=1 Tax=Vitis vinifera TaxID=29760 RepID=D7TGW4_VITVI
MGWSWILIIQLNFLIGNADGYDPLDPNGNIAIKWDVLQWSSSSYDARVSIINYQLYRHIETPGWKLSWTWPGDEVIWDMWGALAHEQGNCSEFKGEQLPYCCEKTPLILDRGPGTPFNKQVANCCRDGLLTSMIQDPSKHGAMFQMNVGTASSNVSDMTMPRNFSLGVPGYTCGDPFQVPPSRFPEEGGRRWTQALMTWNVSCSYSQFLASTAPTCCVSLSAFYNSTIVPCPQCSCGCEGIPGTKCAKPGETPLLLPQGDGQQPDLVRCSRHMCPIRVHWHVKTSYREYWRVKITVTNLNLVKNYSAWNLVVLHPNLQSITQVFSFNYRSLNEHGTINDTGMFWGIQYYNELLLQAGESGNVQTEMLLHKDPGIFTFREGWAFPRKISFNGDQCVMPSPDEYPRLPNTGPSATPPSLCIILLLSLSVIVML